MSDPDLDLIQQTHGAHAALMARINSFLDEVDGDVAAAIALAQAELGARQAAYDELAADLIQVVHDEMDFVATVDPTDPAPTNVRGGTFATMRDAINAAPGGSSVNISIPEATAIDFDHDITVDMGKQIVIEGQGATRPVFTVQTRVAAGTNWPFRFIMNQGSSLYLRNLDIVLGPKADGALAYHDGGGFVLSGQANHLVVETQSISFTGEGGFDLVNLRGARVATVSALQSTFDGDVAVIGRGGLGANAILSAYNLTLANGASLHSTDFVVGTNLLLKEW